MKNSVFGNLDRQKTIDNFEQYLHEWHDWKVKALRRFPGLHSPSMDGQPNDGTPHDPDLKQINHSEAEYQCHERENVCKVMASISEEDEILADLLLHRYIKRESPTKTMDYLSDKYGVYWSERTYREKQAEALWEGAMICPVDSVRVKSDT